MLDWTRDCGYCEEETARRGDFAAVICPPYYTDNGWGIQIFDEADDEAMEYGETYMRVDNLPTAAAAKRVAEAILEEIASARA